MKPFVDCKQDRRATEELRRYLQSIFGVCSWEDLPAPGLGATFVVTEALQTCHPTSGTGLDVNNALPPGRYMVIGHDRPQGGHVMRSYHLTLVNLGTRLRVELCYGYIDTSCLDWRGIEKCRIDAQDEAVLAPFLSNRSLPSSSLRQVFT